MKNLLRNILLTTGLIVFCASSHAFDLMSPEGSSKSLQAAVTSGKWNLVMLWSHDCVSCERQKPLIDKFYRQYESRGVDVFGISTDFTDHSAEVLSLIERNPTKYSDFFYSGKNFDADFTRLIGDKFVASPTYIIYDKTGKIAGVHVGTLNRAMLDSFFKDKVKVQL